jgi:hypothetical protein
MPKLNLYTQQTVASSQRASGEAFGASIGRAVADFGNTLGQIEDNRQRREEVIGRVQLMNSFDQAAITDLEAVQADGSIASKETVDNYTGALRQRMDQAIQQHRGSSASRAELRAHLENQLGQYTKSAMGAQIKAQYALIGDTADKLANKNAITATLAPDQMTNAFAQFDSELSKLQGSISQDQYDKFRNVGRARIANGAIKGLLQRGNFTEAQKLLQDPNVGGMLDADTSRALTMDIAVDSAKKEVEVATQNQNIAQWTSILKRNLTPEEQLRVRMLPAKKSEYTAADKIVELELVQGKPASPSQVTQIMGMPGMFGNSMQGMALDYVTTNAVAYANGMLSPDEARRYEASVTEAYKPIEKQDPNTGQWTRIAPQVPSFVQQAMSRGGRIYAGGMSGAPAASMSQPTPIRGSVTSEAPAATPAGQPAAAPAAPAATPTSAPPAPGAQTIWSRRSNVTGVVPTAMEVAGRVPVLGEAIGGGGQYATDRQYVETQSRDLIRALSQSGRYLASEMQSIEKEVSLSGQAFDNPVAYGQRLIGIDEALAKRAEDAKKDLTNPEITLDKRKAAMDVIATITNFRASMGVPPRVKSVEEARKLAPGSEFIDPNGVVRVVPGR